MAPRSWSWDIFEIIGIDPAQVKPRNSHKFKPDSHLTPVGVGRTMVGLPQLRAVPCTARQSYLRGRPRFDGDTVSQDACRGPFTS
jgi:hypothetical protein